VGLRWDEAMVNRAQGYRWTACDNWLSARSTARLQITRSATTSAAARWPSTRV